MTTINNTNVVEVEMLTHFFSATGIAGGNCSLRLFTNDVKAGLTPAQVKARVTADFTQATFAGYAAISLTPASWTITGGVPTAAVNTLRTFERTTTGAQQSVRGYYVVRSSDSRLMFFHQFAGPLVTEFAGHRIEFVPRYAMQDFGA